MLRRQNKENLREKRRKKFKENLLSQKTSIFEGKIARKTDVYTSSNVKMQNNKIVLKNAVFLFLNIPPWFRFEQFKVIFSKYLLKENNQNILILNKNKMTDKQTKHARKSIHEIIVFSRDFILQVYSTLIWIVCILFLNISWIPIYIYLF